MQAGAMPPIVDVVRRVEIIMSKGRDTKGREDKKKPAKNLKEKRAEKAAKKDGTHKPGTIGTTFGDR
jgi:hypothetical protein